MSVVHVREALGHSAAFMCYTLIPSSPQTVAVTRLEEQVLLLCLHVDTERRRLLSRGETLRMFFAWLLTVMRR